jgi:hypothetical protein
MSKTAGSTSDSVIGIFSVQVTFHMGVLLRMASVVGE